MTARSNTHLLIALSAFVALGLQGCAGDPVFGHAEAHPDPVLPTTQYAMTAQTMVRPMNFRVNPNGLSDNQRRALDQIASRAAWEADAPVDVEIVTSGEPHAMAAGHAMAGYLSDHDVVEKNLTVRTAQEQAPDIVTVNLIIYRPTHIDCNQSWENLTATADNKTYVNFGCAVTANMAMQVADPRDIAHPATPTSADAGRKSQILDKYRQGQITSTASDDNAKGTISDAIK